MIKRSCHVLVTCCLVSVIACDLQSPYGALDPSAPNPAQRPDGSSPVGSVPPGCDSAFTSLPEIGPWFIGSEELSASGAGSVMIGGFGSRIEEVEIALGAPSFAGCRLIEPEVVVDLDGASIHIVGTDSSDAESCSLELSAIVDPCGQRVFLGFLTVNVFDLDSTGRITVDGVEAGLDTLQLTGLRPPEGVACESWPDSLDGMDWELGTESPVGIFPGDSDIGFSAHVSGFDNVIEYAGAYEEVDYEVVAIPGGEVGSYLNCYGNFPPGSVTFDGTNLTVSASLDSEWSGSMQPCFFEYTGSVTSCELFSPFVSGSDEGPVQIIKTAGIGTARAGDAEFVFGTLYLTATPRPVPSVELCDDDFVPLEDGNRWRVMSRDPFERGPYEPALLNMEGSGSQVRFYEGIPPDDQMDRRGYCVGGDPDGFFFTDGEELAFEVTGSDGETSCSVAFEGVLASCETKIDDAVFYSDEEVRLLRFDGAGTLTTSGGSFPFPTLYFVRSAANDDVDYPIVAPPYPVPVEPPRDVVPVEPPLEPPPAKP